MDEAERERMRLERDLDRAGAFMAAAVALMWGVPLLMWAAGL